jgi:hypothetical protein
MKHPAVQPTTCTRKNFRSLHFDYQLQLLQTHSGKNGDQADIAQELRSQEQSDLED